MKVLVIGGSLMGSPVPEGVQCYSIAATTGKESTTLGGDLLSETVS